MSSLEVQDTQEGEGNGGNSREDDTTHEILEKYNATTHPKHMALRNFSTVWFTISLDTGVLSIITHNLPWQFAGLGIISTVLFVLNLVLFTTFSCIVITRWIMFTKEAYHKTFADTEEIAFLAAPAIAYLTLVAQDGLTCSTAWGHSWTILAYVLWWVGVLWIFFICTMLYTCLVRNQLSNDETLPTAVFLPIVGMMTAAVIGGDLAVYFYDISPRLAEPMIIVSYLCLGYALFLALTMYAQYMHRLILTGWPEPAKIPGMILTIGPMGQSATALQILGTAASSKNIFAGYNRGIFLQGQAAEIIFACSIMLALLLVGFAIFWICVAYFAIIEALIKRKLHLGLIWWSTIFPVGTVATACISLGKELDSCVFKGLAAGLLIWLVLIYLFNACFTIPLTLSGHLIGIPKKGKHGETEPARRPAFQDHHCLRHRKEKIAMMRRKEKVEMTQHST